MEVELYEPDVTCLLKAFQLQRPRRTPFWDVIYGFPRELAEALLAHPLDQATQVYGQQWDYSPRDQLELAYRLGIDTIGFRAGWSFGGDLWQTGSDGEYRYGGGQIRNRSDLQDLPPLNVDEFRQKLEWYLDTIEDTGAGVFVGLPGVFHDVLQSVGYVDFMLALYDDPSFVEELLDISVERNRQVVDALAVYPVTFFRFYEDVAHNQGLMIQPDMFRALWLPRVKHLISPVQHAGIPATLHCCGKLQEMLPLAIECGFAAIDPFQPDCNDIYALHREFGQQICFMGNIGTDVLVAGPAERIAQLAREQIAHLGRNGGYVVRPNALTRDVPAKHLLALARAVRSMNLDEL